MFVINVMSGGSRLAKKELVAWKGVFSRSNFWAFLLFNMCTLVLRAMCF